MRFPASLLDTIRRFTLRWIRPNAPGDVVTGRGSEPYQIHYQPVERLTGSYDAYDIERREPWLKR
jgi:hypothetical protein